MLCKKCGSEMHDTLEGWCCPNCGDTSNNTVQGVANTTIHTEDFQTISTSRINDKCPGCGLPLLVRRLDGKLECQACGDIVEIYNERNKPTHMVDNNEYVTLPYRPSQINGLYNPDESHIPSYVQYGWVCPLCGRSLAPHVDSCPCSQNIKITFASTQTEQLKNVIDC